MEDGRREGDDIIVLIELRGRHASFPEVHRCAFQKDEWNLDPSSSSLILIPCFKRGYCVSYVPR